jgi:hypothetical protein
LRSDNGGEYTSNDFKDFCKEVGIKRELTVSYNPQQNGVAKRKNQSIIGSAKAMIHDQDLPMFLWEEACNMTLYVQNKSPHKILGDKTPEETFTGVKPEIGHLRIFGCPVYIHVPMEKRTKLEPLGEKGIWLGDNIAILSMEKRAHLFISNRSWAHTIFIQVIGKLFVNLVMAPIIAATRFSDYVTATNPNPCVQALMMKHLT